MGNKRWTCQHLSPPETGIAPYNARGFWITKWYTSVIAFPRMVFASGAWSSLCCEPGSAQQFCTQRLLDAGAQAQSPGWGFSSPRAA